MIPRLLNSQKWLLLSLLVAIGMFSSHWDQLRFICLFIFAVFCLSFIGSVFSHGLDKNDHPRNPRAGTTFFMDALLGQFIAAIVVIVLSPIISVLSGLIGIHTPIFFVLGLFIVLVALIYRKTAPAKSAVMSGSAAQKIFVFSGLGVLAYVASLYSLDLSPLGLDTHQHIYWVQHIVDYGFLPLTARDTNVIESYPKGLHLLTAIWSGFGFGAFTGASLKMMPFLQSFLVAFSAAEIGLNAAREKTNRFIIPFEWIVCILSILLVSSITIAINTVYPYPDLNHTGQLSAAAIVCLPLLSSARGIFSGNNRWLIVGLASLLPGTLFAFSVNPVLIFIFFGVNVLPAFFSLWILGRNKFLFKLPFLTSMMMAVSLSVILLLANGYLLDKLANSSPAVASLLELTGVESTAHAIKTGVKKIVSTAGKQGEECASLDCGYIRFSEAWKKDSNRVLGDIFSVNPERLLPGGFRFSYWKLKAFWLFYWLGILISLVKFPRLIFDQRCTFMLLLPVSILLLPLFLTSIAVFIQIFSGGVTFEWYLLSEYLQIHTLFSVYYLYPLLLGLGLYGLTLSFSVKKDSRRLGSDRHKLWPLTFVILLVMLFALKRTDKSLPKNVQHIKNMSYQQIETFREVEESSEISGPILTVPTYKVLNGENWIVPSVGSEFLPYSTEKYLFNVNLGYGYLFTWENFKRDVCESSIKDTRAFLKSNQVGWVYLYDENVEDRVFYDQTSICGKSIESLGVRYPPRYVANGKNGFFKIDIE